MCRSDDASPRSGGSVLVEPELASKDTDMDTTLLPRRTLLATMAGIPGAVALGAIGSPDVPDV